MILKIDQLMAKKVVEIRSMLVNRGAGWKNHENKTVLVNRLMEIEGTTQPDDKKVEAENKKPQTKKKVVVPLLTDAQVTAALEPFIAGGLKLRFSPDGTNWAIQYNKKVDSGNMTMPLKTVVRCAELVGAQRVAV